MRISFPANNSNSELCGENHTSDKKKIYKYIKRKKIVHILILCTSSKATLHTCDIPKMEAMMYVKTGGVVPQNFSLNFA